MRIFVFEYITGGGMLDRELPGSLAEEGDMMLHALASDLAEVGGVELLVTRDARLGRPELPAEFLLLTEFDDLSRVWEDCLDAVDGVWPIAPESDGTLEAVCAAVEASGKLLLSSPATAVARTASKRATIQRLAEAGVAVVPTYRIDDEIPECSGQWVLKPDLGAGCLGSRIFATRKALFDEIDSLPEDQPGYIVQPFIPGTAASISMIARGGEVAVLSTNLQRIVVMNNSFVLLGCEVNGVQGDTRAYRELGQAVGKALSDLWGFVGIDLIDTGNGLKVLEVNPRLTTSYVGLKASIGINPAALVLDLLQSDRPMPHVSGMGTRVDVNLEYASAV
ncbi:MAG: ATP-grasp domain-containing protein [Gammaproteobacteria bacterium]|nr:ATP-grasp domain-containing protein [Gammaproteobacteria bacterium]